MSENCIKACRKASELKSKSFEEKLSFIETVSLYSHLALCKTCQIAFKQLTALRDICPNYPSSISDQDPILSEEAKQRIKSNIGL